jgi:hypothetical protein
MIASSFEQLVTDVLKKMDTVRPGFYKHEAVQLLCMICAHESKGCKFRRQLGGGPARGVLQIEKETHDSVWNNSDTIDQVAKALGITRDWDNVVDDDVYSIFVGRHLIAMDPHKIPVDTIGLGDYAKRVWNTELGKATGQKYIDDWSRWANGVC